MTDTANIANRIWNDIHLVDQKESCWNWLSLSSAVDQKGFGGFQRLVNGVAEGICSNLYTGCEMLLFWGYDDLPSLNRLMAALQDGHHYPSGLMAGVITDQPYVYDHLEQGELRFIQMLYWDGSGLSYLDREWPGYNHNPLRFKTKLDSRKTMR